MATRCCSPPDSSAGPVGPAVTQMHRLEQGLEPVGVDGRSPPILSGSVMFSSAVRTGSRLNVWKTKPIAWRRISVRSWSESESSRVPASSTQPAVGRSSPARMCIRVDLPEPDGPMIAVNVPRSNATETPRSASTAVGPSP